MDFPPSLLKFYATSLLCDGLKVCFDVNRFLFLLLFENIQGTNTKVFVFLNVKNVGQG